MERVLEALHTLHNYISMRQLSVSLGRTGLALYGLWSRAAEILPTSGVVAITGPDQRARCGGMQRFSPAEKC